MVLFPLSSMCRAASTCTPRSLNWAARKMAQNKKVTLLLLCIAHLLGGATVEAGAGNNIEQTPSWKIGIFFGFFLVLSVLLEIGLEVLEEYLEHHHLHGVMMTVEKIKEELMLMGFISLCLLIVEDYLVEWCIDNEGGDVGVPANMCMPGKTCELENYDDPWVCGMYHCSTPAQCEADFGVLKDDMQDLQGLQPSGPQWKTCSCYVDSSSGAGSNSSSSASSGRLLASSDKCVP